MIRCFHRGSKTSVLNDESGAPLVELALLIPFLSLLVFGMMEFANLLYQQQIVTKGAQEAGRFLARNPAVVESGTCPPSAPGLGAAETAAINVATTGQAGTSGTPRIPGFTASTVSISYSCPATGSLISSVPDSGQIPIVTVSVRLDAASLGFLNFLGLSSIELTATHEEMGIGL